MTPHYTHAVAQVTTPATREEAVRAFVQTTGFQVLVVLCVALLALSIALCIVAYHRPRPVNTDDPAARARQRYVTGDIGEAGLEKELEAALDDDDDVDVDTEPEPADADDTDDDQTETSGFDANEEFHRMWRGLL